MVKPETAIAWHRKGFRLFWTWKSNRGHTGRPKISKELRNLTYLISNIVSSDEVKCRASLILSGPQSRALSLD
jgi:hypothetical protein